MKLVVGLGNPGEKYQNVRHNLGWSVIDALVAGSRYQVVWEDNKKLKSLVLKVGDVIFAKPLTYMNNSGLAVGILASYYKVAPEDIIVVYDEMDLPLGKIKVRRGGAAAGHHGVESVIKGLGTDQFIRVRMGIEPSEGFIRQPEKFVLESFIPKEKPQVKHMVKQAVKALDLLLEKGLEKAQNQFN